MKSIPRVIKVLSGLLFLGIVCFAWLPWNLNRPPFELARLQLLRPGMSQHEVRQILGIPQSDDDNHWAYSRFMAWPVVYVHFDENRQFTRSEFDY